MSAQPKRPKPARKKLSEQKDMLKILYYGEAGSGKTTALASMAKLGRILVVDAESGLKQRPLKELGIPVENIEVFSDTSLEGMEELYHDLRAELHEDPTTYVGVVIDSITEIQKKLQEQVMAQAVLKSQRKGIERDRFRVYQDDWNTLSSQMRLLIRGFRDLPCHVGFSALERRDQDDDGVVQYGPATTPAVAGDLKGYVDIGCYMKVQNERKGGETEEYTGVFRPVGKFWAKDRFHAVPRVMMDPSVDRVYQYVTGQYSSRATIIASKGGKTTGDNVDSVQAAWRIAATQESS